MMNKINQSIALIRHHPGMSISVFIHLILFAFLLVSFPQCKKKPLQEVVISVDLLPISKKTNVENKQANEPKPKKDAKPLEKPKPVETPKPELETPKPVEKLEPIEEPQKLQPVEKPTPDLTNELKKPVSEVKEIKPQNKIIEKKEPEKKKKAKPKVSEFDALLKTLEDTVQKTDKNEERIQKTTKGPSDKGLALSLSIKDSIKKQIEQCWNPPAGNKDAGKLQILLNISFKSDGSVASAKIVDNIKYTSDELYRVAADAAVRAVYKCSPLQDLPVDQYNLWRNLEFNFDPSNLIY